MGGGVKGSSDSSRRIGHEIRNYHAYPGILLQNCCPWTFQPLIRYLLEQFNVSLPYSISSSAQSPTFTSIRSSKQSPAAIWALSYVTSKLPIPWWGQTGGGRGSIHYFRVTSKLFAWVHTLFQSERIHSTLAKDSCVGRKFQGVQSCYSFWRQTSQSDSISIPNHEVLWPQVTKMRYNPRIRPICRTGRPRIIHKDL